MAQYVLEIENERLMKCYEVSAEYPIRTPTPGRTQCVITDTDKFNKAVAAYSENKEKAHFFWDGTTLTCDKFE